MQLDIDFTEVLEKLHNEIPVPKGCKAPLKDNRIITKSSKQVKEEILNYTCPECDYCHKSNKMVMFKYYPYNMYKCNKCGCEWQVDKS